MCKGTQKIAYTPNGLLEFCRKCKRYHIQFKNIYFEFTPYEMSKFKEYLHDLDSEYWEQKHRYNYLRKKVPIPTLQSNLFLVFNTSEIEELKTLFFNEKNAKYLRAKEINYQPFLN